MKLRQVLTVLSFSICIAVSPGSSENASCGNCAATSTGFTPLSDLGKNLYKGFPGGLYPGGTNTRPAKHETAGLNIAKAIQTLNSNGQRNSNGRYVLLSIGMSNTTAEFSAFQQLSKTDSDKDPKLVIVDGAQGGWPANEIVNPNAVYWRRIDQRLARSRVTSKQVVIAWIKQADAHPTLPFPQHAHQLKQELITIVQILKKKFPNLRLAYLSSRIYAGYATTELNPEPYAYESGFAVKWLIRDQIQGQPELSFDSTKGPISAPWLAWGPYLWADGLVARSDGLIWKCGDLKCDGTHPSKDSGVWKVAEMLLDFFRTDSTAREWYLK